MTTTLPAPAVAANATALTDAFAAASISSSPSPESEPKSLDGTKGESEDRVELEDGEIREAHENGNGGLSDVEEDDGRVKTVFDDANRFNVKVGWESNPRTRCRYQEAATGIAYAYGRFLSIRCSPNGPCSSIPPSPNSSRKRLHYPQPLKSRRVSRKFPVSIPHLY